MLANYIDLVVKVVSVCGNIALALWLWRIYRQRRSTLWLLAALGGSAWTIFMAGILIQIPLHTPQIAPYVLMNAIVGLTWVGMIIAKLRNDNRTGSQGFGIALHSSHKECLVCKDESGNPLTFDMDVETCPHCQRELMIVHLIRGS